MQEKSPHSLSTPVHVWDRIDHSLLDCKLEEIAEEMRRKIDGDKAKAYEEYQKKGDVESYLAERVRCEEGRAAEWVERQFQAAVEVWRIQGNQPSAVFFKTVYDWLLSFFLSERMEVVSDEIASEYKSVGRRDRRQAEYAVEQFSRAVIRLGNRWKRKIDAAIIEREYDVQAIALPVSLAPFASSASKPKVRGDGPTGPRPKYRSKIKQAIRLQLTLNPAATDLEICSSLDSDGAIELQKSWQPTPGKRSFVEAYKNGHTKPRIEKTISKIRADLRKWGLL